MTESHQTSGIASHRIQFLQVFAGRHLRSGEIGAAVENATGRNYRGPTWVVPAPGVDAVIRFF